MANFYFTYGSTGHPFYGGWTVIDAPNFQIAATVFRAYHPDRHRGLMDCCCAYDEANFKSSGMADRGNFGFYCHEVITLRHELATHA